MKKFITKKIILIIGIFLFLNFKNMQSLGQENISAINSINEIFTSVVKNALPSVVIIKSDFGWGSGVIVDKEGYIVTNKHVVFDKEKNQETKKIEVTFHTGETESAFLLWDKDPNIDIAIITIPKTRMDNIKVEPLKLGDIKKAQQGEWVIVIGHPELLYFTSTAGIISNVGLAGFQIESSFPGYYVQTDAPINGGNSGGALVNLKGELIGIPTAKFSAEGIEGIGFAIPVNIVKRIVNDLKNFKRVRQPYYGIDGETINSAEKELYNIKGGMKIITISAGPISLAGLKKGDIIINIDSIEVNDRKDVFTLLMDKQIGEKSEIIYKNDDGQHSAKIITAEKIEEITFQDIGIQIKDTEITAIEDDGYAQRGGCQKGDKIVKAGIDVSVLNLISDVDSLEEQLQYAAMFNKRLILVIERNSEEEKAIIDIPQLIEEKYSLH